MSNDFLLGLTAGLAVTCITTAFQSIIHTKGIQKMERNFHTEYKKLENNYLSEYKNLITQYKTLLEQKKTLNRIYSPEKNV